MEALRLCSFMFVKRLRSPKFSVDEFHAEPELGVTSCSDVLLSSGTPSNGGDPASYESLDSSFGVSAGSPPVTWPVSHGCMGPAPGGVSLEHRIAGPEEQAPKSERGVGQILA